MFKFLQEVSESPVVASEIVVILFNEVVEWFLSVFTLIALVAICTLVVKSIM